MGESKTKSKCDLNTRYAAEFEETISRFRNPDDTLPLHITYEKPLHITYLLSFIIFHHVNYRSLIKYVDITQRRPLRHTSASGRHHRNDLVRCPQIRMLLHEKSSAM